MRDVQPREQDKAVIVWVEKSVLEFWPTQQEYFPAISRLAGQFYSLQGQEVEDPSSPNQKVLIMIATSMINAHPMNKYMNDPSIWKKAIEIFLPVSSRAITLKCLDDLSYSWFESFLIREEYHDVRVMMR